MKRRAVVIAVTAVLATAVLAPSASMWVDKQYRSTSLSNLRKHSIRVTFSGCATWRARASVKWGSTYDTYESTAKGCKKSVLLTAQGNLKANVTLTIHHQEPTDVSGSVVIKPVK